MRGFAACPTDWKRVFHDEAAAAARAAVVSAEGGDELEVYSCPCGEWHLRNRTKYAAKQDFHARQRWRRVRLEAARAHERHALGLDDEDAIVTESAPKEVTDEYGSADSPGGDSS